MRSHEWTSTTDIHLYVAPTVDEKWRSDNRRNFSIFVSCIMEQPVIRRKTMVKRATVRSLIALLRRAPIAANRPTLLTKYVIWTLERESAITSIRPPVPRLRIDFQFSQIFSISLSCPLFTIPPLCLYSAQLWKLRAARQESRLFFLLKLTSAISH